MADTFDEARTAITALIRPVWNTATDRAPIIYDNIDQERPGGSTWGRLTIRHSPGGGRASIGNRARVRRPGRMYFQIFVPKDSGMEEVDAIGEALVTAIEDAGAVGNLWFRDVSQSEVGPDIDEAFFQCNVEASFTWDRVT